MKPSKKILLATALSATFGVTVPAWSQPITNILFNPMGTGLAGAQQIDAFDWLPGSGLVLDGNLSTRPAGSTDPVISLVHSTLSSATLGGGVVFGDLTPRDITFVLSFPEIVTNLFPGVANIADFDPLGTPNFFEIYVGGDMSNPLAGTGYNDAGGATLILRGAIVAGGGIYRVSDLDRDGSFIELFDQNGTDDYAGLQTVEGNGSTNVKVRVDFADANYFPGGVETLNLFFGTNVVTPFRETNPSRLFWDGLALVTPVLGTLNGGPSFDDDGNPICAGTGDCDFQFQTNAANSFGCSGRIGDFVWNDLNRDGIQDADELGIANVKVLLKDGTGAVIDEKQTNGQGKYLFEGLCADTYTVEVDETTLPPDFVASPSFQGGDPALDSNGSPAEVILPTGASEDLTIDFGYNSPCTGAIGDFVWNDLDRDGIQDADEPGIAGVTVWLKDDKLEVIATAVTDGNGQYLFQGVCAGAYTVEVDETTLPANFVPSPSFQGGDPASDSNGSPAEVILPNDSSEDLTIDFGYNSPCTGVIGDFVWNDLDRDGIQDDGEPGIAGVTVWLKDDKLEVIATAVTDDNGQYLFQGVCADTYLVEVDKTTLPPGFVPSPSFVGDDREIDSNGSPAGVILETDASEDLTIDFGYFEARPAIDLEKATNGFDADDPTGPFIPVGDTVTWTYVATNTGNVNLVDVVVTDDQLGTICTIPTLAVGAKATCTKTGTAEEGQYANLGTACGVDGAGTQVCDDDPSHYFGARPAIDLEKATNGQDADTPTGPSIPVGGAVTWTYVVTNVGNVDLVDVVVTDDQLGEICTIQSLAVGASDTCTATGTATEGQYANLGTATGMPPVGPNVTDTDPSHYFGEAMVVGGQGCTPGYWRQPHHFFAWAPYAPNTLFSAVFEDAFPGKTLLDVVKLGGGGLNALGRHTVAALLNAASPNVSYDLSVAEVIDQFNAVYPGSNRDYENVKNRFEGFNEQGCPLGRAPR